MGRGSVSQNCHVIRKSSHTAARPFCVLAKEAVELLRSNGFRAARLEHSVHDWHARGLPIAVGEEPAHRRLTRAH
jgi:hypothetical protein